MISNKSVKEIACIFCGDIEKYYLYKSGPVLVDFFNKNFNTKDVYQSGFPSRWAYVYNKIMEILNLGKIDSFFSLILSKEYLMKEHSINEVAAVKLSENILKRMNKILLTDSCKIIRKNSKYYLVDSNDLLLIGSGGFADVYRQISTGLVVKKLKDEFLSNDSIRRRFKREYLITKSLQGENGIIKVFSFDEENYSYTMEQAEMTLEKYVLDNELSDLEKLQCIRQILNIISTLHMKNIIHRDISANNIFIVSGQLKIADFGLGKNLDSFASHQTLNTNSFGQYIYCAPEQFKMLKSADKRSDVYSLGRLINFIMTKDATNYHHIYRNVAEKATCQNVECRYEDANQLSFFFEKAVEYHKKEEIEKKIEQKIAREEYDSDVENYIYDLDSESIAKNILDHKKGFTDSLFLFMLDSEEHAQYIIQSINNSFKNVCGKKFKAYDEFSYFACRVLNGKFSYIIKEIAANILSYIAWKVNRFSARRMIEELIKNGIEPLLEDILEKKKV